MFDLSIPVSIAYLGLLWLAYRSALALYNISPYHPLARFPGPKLAAASYLYEAYYDWWLVGRYGKVIARMHERYGMAPCKLSISQIAIAPELENRSR